MGVYCINAARYLFGAEPTKVLALSARSRERRFQKVDEMMSAVLHFPEECLASFTCSFGAADISRYTVVGTKGVLTCDPAYEYATDIGQEVIAGGKKSKRKFAKRDQFAAEITYFSDCILQNGHRNPPGSKDWRTCGSCAPSTNQHAAAQRSHCLRFPARKSLVLSRRFIGPPTASPKPSILSLPPANPRDEQRPVRYGYLSCGGSSSALGRP